MQSTAAMEMELVDMLEEAKQAFDQWTLQQFATVEDAKKTHLRTMETLQQQVEELSPSGDAAEVAKAASRTKEHMSALEAAAARKAERERELQHLAQAIKLYQERLGLRFVGGEGDGLRFEFGDCFVTLDVDADRKFVVRECVPAVPSMDEHLAELNRTNNLGRFVAAIRQAHVHQ